MFVIRVSYPGGHSVWLTRRFPTVAWGLKKDAVPFPTEADAARTIARLRPSGPVSIEPIARLSGRKGPLAPSKVKHRAAPVEVLPHALRQGIPRRGGAGEFCVPQRQTKQLGNLQCIKHRPTRRP